MATGVLAALVVVWLVHGSIEGLLLESDGFRYWTPLLDFLRERLLAAGNVDADDLRLLDLVDTPAEALAIVRARALPAAQHLLRRPPHPSRVLREA